MAINSTGLLPGQGAGDGNNRASSPLSQDVIEALSTVSLRCVECSTVYPAATAGSPAPSPRYRCDCGGVLDVEMPFRLPKQQALYAQDGGNTQAFELDFATESDSTPSAGAAWRQLFDERAANPPIWSISTDKMLLDSSGVWRYRELLLPAPERYVVSRPEGNTGLYPVGIENCGSGRLGHRQIGLYAGLERFFFEARGRESYGQL